MGSGSAPSQAKSAEEHVAEAPTGRIVAMQRSGRAGRKASVQVAGGVLAHVFRVRARQAERRAGPPRIRTE